MLTIEDLALQRLSSIEGKNFGGVPKWDVKMINFGGPSPRLASLTRSKARKLESSKASPKLQLYNISANIKMDNGLDEFEKALAEEKKARERAEKHSSREKDARKHRHHHKSSHKHRD